MFKNKILIAANSAVLFGCIVLAAVSIGGCSDPLHNSSNTMSTTQVSESFSIRDEGTTDNLIQGTSPIETTTTEVSTTPGMTTDSSTDQPSDSVLPTTEQQTTTIAPTTEAATTEIVESTADNDSTSTTQEETTSVDAAGNTETTEPTTEGPTVDINSEDNAVFSFTKVIIDKPDFDYYSKLIKDKNYKNIKNIEELSSFSKDILKLKDGKKQVKYIITSKGLFDDMAVAMEKLKANAELNPTFYNFNKRDRFLCDTLGLDYQKYYTNGVALFMIKKVQDIENNVNSNSVYAVYYYAYNTYEQIALQNKLIKNIVSSFAGTDYEKIYAAHEYLKDTVNYIDNGSYLVQTAYGAIINKEAVCEGYAKAYKLLLNAMGIECDVVINSEHAWNVVKLDGKWYLVDVTNDDTNDGLAYFLLGKDVLVGDNDTAEYFGYNDGSNTDVRELAEISYVIKTEE